MKRKSHKDKIVKKNGNKKQDKNIFKKDRKVDGEKLDK